MLREKNMKSVLFVCLGNICRSPACEGVARKMYGNNVKFDSAGTGNYHVGESPDYRSISACKKHGVDISSHRARQVNTSDWKNFDLLVALDNSVFNNLKRRRPSDARAAVALFDEQNGGVDDPWYGDASGFDVMYEQIERVMPDFLKQHNII
ncbi:low molecular weight phosphotyrosine protein phosphatase [Tritrichomonas foetus]|uniref:Low molecular weight phosphotyrosine protein phosphatase n=1 Tax=Tritrichomonas foetus TaxID=1144522 RepID=A0A1J4L1B6_9EUKA|nr:low molecular weight phosphotyrosine protein phosphatase [Tritrichomonas foetus]|eukprot:OHT15756.1 low molecular weight phosphotyrosine protein phosphatase [Tritrichomonas foetus]